MRPSPPPPPAILAAALLAQRLVPGRRSAPRPLSTLTAATLAAGSGALALTAMTGFRKAETTLDPKQPELSRRLVTGGVNRLTRNPIYAGMAGVAAAHALWRGGIAAWVPVAAFVAAIDRLQIPAEEAALANTFGDEYEAYRSRVRRWL